VISHGLSSSKTILIKTVITDVDTAPRRSQNTASARPNGSRVPRLLVVTPEGEREQFAEPGVNVNMQMPTGDPKQPAPNSGDAAENSTIPSPKPNRATADAGDAAQNSAPMPEPKPPVVKAEPIRPRRENLSPADLDLIEYKKYKESKFKNRCK